jgi:P-aminobenzoate N-oxygenase AurF
MQATASYADLLGRLSAHSVTKKYDAYADVDWDHPDHRIALDDPRFELDEDDPLGRSAFYQALPQASRARMGLQVIAYMMKTGVQFEGILSRGLFEFASTRPNGSPEFRYAYHEVIEEAQHSLMFQEFINRTGLEVTGLGRLEQIGARGVPALGRTWPERFFIHVLAGESPIDWVQRRLLSTGRARHPLLRRILQIHVTEEARHLCFATRFLRENVPRLDAFTRARLRVMAPFIIHGTVSRMVRVPPEIVRGFAIPPEVVREVHASPVYKERVREGIRPVRDLCEELGILHPFTLPLWKWFGLSAPTSPAA